MNSYDESAVNQGLLLDLQFREGTGTVTQDWAKPRHPITMIDDPVWTSISGLQVLDFIAPSDYLSCAGASCADLNFTSGAFTLAVWMYPDTGTRMVFCRGLFGADGWYSQTSGTRWTITTIQPPAAYQYSESAEVFVTSYWHFGAITRSGTSARIYHNGIDKTTTVGTHVNPLTSARNLYIGQYDDNTMRWDGLMYRPRIWNRALAPEEIFYIWQSERRLFNV